MKSIAIEDIYEETYLCWKCPCCGETNLEETELQIISMDILDCKSCGEETVVED